MTLFDITLDYGKGNKKNIYNAYIRFMKENGIMGSIMSNDVSILWSIYFSKLYINYFPHSYTDFWFVGINGKYAITDRNWNIKVNKWYDYIGIITNGWGLNIFKKNLILFNFFVVNYYLLLNKCKTYACN
jgi:hypothetical protein